MKKREENYGNVMVPIMLLLLNLSVIFSAYLLFICLNKPSVYTESHTGFLLLFSILLLPQLASLWVRNRILWGVVVCASLISFVTFFF